MKIALSGKQGSGKSTVANYLIEKHNFIHLSFAKAIKEYAMEKHGLTWEQAFGREKNRELLQQIGLEGRQIDENYWVNHIVDEIRKEPDRNYIIDDVRYRNEYDILKDAGFVMVRIEADEQIRMKRLGTRFANPNHISETDLDSVQEWHIIFQNNGESKYIASCCETLLHVGDSDASAREPADPPGL